jgi:outer membrane receptor protein involved in Fe transport
MTSFNLRAGLLFPPFLLFLINSSVFAAEDDSWQDETGNIETVQVTGTRSEASVHDISVAITTVNQDQVLAQAPDVLPEMLRGLPGTYFQQTTPGQGVPIIRGLKGSQILHLVDGMRINNAFFRDAPNQYIGLVDPFAIGRIEVVRGAAGSLYGADAMGGVVNFLTPDIPTGRTESAPRGRIYGSWNSVDDGLVFRAQTQHSGDSSGFSAGASWQDHSNRKTGSGEVIRPSGYRSRSVDAKWVKDIGNHADLMISAQALEQPSTPRSDELVAGFGQDEPASTQFLFQPNNRHFLHARYRSDSNADWLDRYQIGLARQVINDDRLTQDAGTTTLRSETNKSTLDGLTLQFDSSTFGGMHFTWGFEFYDDTIRSGRQQLDTANGVSETVRSRFPDNSTMQSSAAYLSSEWQPSEKTTLGAGIRYSSFDIQLSSIDENNVTKLTPDDFTGDLRLIYALSDSTNLVANVGRGFRPPNIFDLGTLGNRPGNRFNIANTNLRPESVLSHDLGFKTQTGNLHSEFFVFLLNYEDKISSVATGDITDTGRVVVRSENLAEAKLYGFETGLRWFGGSGTEVYGTLNLTRGEERVEGVSSPADRVPPLNGKLGMLFSPREILSIDTYLLFADSQSRLSARDSDDPRINPAGTSAWMTVNILLELEVTERIDLGIRLENLLDRHYREHGSGIDAPGRNIGAWFTVNF